MLKPEVARDLGVVGIAGRASGFDHDLRRDFPHAFYDQVQFTVPVFTEGDVQRRLAVRREEVCQSLAIIQQVLAQLPAGPIRAEIGELPPTAWRWAMSRAGAARFFIGSAPRPATGWRAARSRTRRCRTGRR